MDAITERVVWPASEKLLWRVPEAAAALGFGRSKIYELIRKGEIPTIMLGGVLRIPADALRKLIAERATLSPSTTL
jgi:excisionase family DNA binding protein